MGLILLMVNKPHYPHSSSNVIQKKLPQLKTPNPITATDPYPLVIRLPCHKDHLFDLECIQPWLRLNATCPLDRKDLLHKREEDLVPEGKDKGGPDEEEEEEEWDEMYA